MLPQEEQEVEEEEEDPKQRLVRRLIEYKRFKEAAENLSLRHWLGRDTFARPRTGAEVERPLARDVEALALAEALASVLAKASVPPPQHDVEFEQWSLVESVEWLMDSLPPGEPVEMQDIFVQLKSRTQRVQAFVAVLEMARIQLVDLEQKSHLGPLKVTGLMSKENADLSMIEDAESGDVAKEA